MLWASVRPAVAFENAKLFIYASEVLWNSYANLGNAQNEVIQTVIPLYNAYAKYLVEPAVYIFLDTISLVFTGEEYHGLITEEQVPYNGYVCDANDPDSMAWCGSFAVYKTALERTPSRPTRSCSARHGGGCRRRPARPSFPCSTSRRSSRRSR